MGAASVAGTHLRKGLCFSKWVGLPLGRTALWLDGMVCCGSTSSQAHPLGRVNQGRVNHIYNTSSQAPPLGRVNHISLSPVISQSDISKSIQGSLPQWCESVLALQAAAVTRFSWSQLTSQQHLPSTFSLIRVQSQRSFSFSISIAQCPATSLLRKEAELQSHCTTLIILQRCQRSRGAPSAAHCPAAIRDQARELHIPLTGKKTALVDRICRALRLARQQSQQQSPQPHRDTPPAPRISANCSPSTVDLTATVQQLIDGSLRGVAERLRRVICPSPPHPPLVSLQTQTPVQQLPRAREVTAN